MEDIVLVQSQDYAQVVFDELNESYPENQDLECVFTLNELVKVEQADWVGIYKVGFTNCRDYVCKKEIDVQEVSDLRAKVVFGGEEIPRDDGEFYQFVFVSQSKQIRGASIPFQFKKRHLSDFIEIEDQEAIIYKSKESAMNETLTEMRQKFDHLNAANDSYAKLIKENEEVISCLKDELSSVKLRCLKVTMDNDRLAYTLKTKTDNLKTLQDQLSALVKENSDIQSNFQNLQNERSDLEKQVREQIDELEKLRDQLNRNEQVVLEQTRTIQSIVGEKDNLSNTVTKILDEKADIETNYKNLMQEFTMCKDKLMAAEQCKEMLRSQLTVTSDELAESSAKNAELNNQIADYLAKCKNSDLNMADLNEKIESLKAGYENKLNEVNGSYYALKLAHGHLETRLRAQDKDSEKLRQENEELKDRVRAGGKEYTKLFEKYRLLKNKQFNHDLNVYTDLCGNELIMKRGESISTDSAIQEKSQSRVSSADIENTLLDALLNSSLNNQPQKSTSTAVGVVNMREQFGKSSPDKETMSDDGLNHEQSRHGDGQLETDANCVIQSCDMCDYVFPTGAAIQDVERHYSEKHYGPSCPVCCLNFRKGYPQSEFEKHVNEHFPN